MRLTTLFLASLPILGAIAAPKGYDGSCSKPPATTTTTSSAAAPPSSTTSAAPLTSPTAPYTVISARSGSPIHLLPVNAGGLSLHLGGATSSYCPIDPSECPPGDVTAFVGLGAMDVEVPGGQLVYVAPDGHVGYTQAHSAFYPPGSVLAPFTWSKDPSSSFGVLSTNAFGATGFMACPTSDNGWQVFAAFSGAVAPLGDVSQCLGFDALTSDYSGIAAWQYT